MRLSEILIPGLHAQRQLVHDNLVSDALLNGALALVV